MIRPQLLNKVNISHAWSLSIELRKDYRDILVIMLGGKKPSEITPQLRYHYSDLAETVLRKAEK